MTKLVVAALFLALNFYTYHFLATEEVLPPRRSFDGFPLEVGDWSCAEQEQMDPAVQRNLGATDYLICNYARRKPREFVGVYVGYHATQVRREGGGVGVNAIHPPAHCLPGSGWDIIDSRTVPLDMEGLPGRPQDVNRLIIAKGEARQLVYYWYQSRGRVIAQDPMKILYVFLDRATSLPRVNVPSTCSNRSKIRSWCFGSIPGPVSTTSIAMRISSCCKVERMRTVTWPCCVNFIAFPIRLVRTCL